MSRRSRCNGFTLVEVLVALTILSLVMLATVSAMRTFGNTSSSLERMTTRIDEIRAVSGFLRDSLETAVVATGAGDNMIGGVSLGPSWNTAATTTYFKGDSMSLVWKAPVFFGESVGGTMLLQVSRVEDRLLLRWQEPPRMSQGVAWENAAERELLTGVQEFSVSYNKDFTGGEWQQEWKQKSSPVLVRLVIKANDRYWPDLILRVQK